MQIFFIMYYRHKLARQLHQERSQVVYSKRQPGIAWLEDTPAIEVGHMNFGLKRM